MLHARCCEKAVHPWVPRRSSAPRPMAGSAEHANEVIMWMPLPLLYSAGLSGCHRRAGHPGNAAKYRCHIWHNERSTPVSVNELPPEEEKKRGKKEKRKKMGRRSISHLAPANDLHKVCMRKEGRGASTQRG